MSDRIRFSLLTLAVALAAMIALTPFAHAAGKTANLFWTAPTQYTDGTALAAGDIGNYTIEACEKNSPTTCITATPAGTATSATMAVVCGDYNSTISVTTSAAAVYPDTTSAPSNSVPYATGVTCSPNPPSALTVN